MFYRIHFSNDSYNIFTKLFFQKVIENGISKRDIVAQKDIKVIDTKKTEQHKKEVVQNVEPILTIISDWN